MEHFGDKLGNGLTVAAMPIAHYPYVGVHYNGVLVLGYEMALLTEVGAGGFGS